MSDLIEKEGKVTQEALSEAVIEPQAQEKAVHESIADAVISAMPEAEKISIQVLALARILEITVRSHLASHAQNQSELAVKNELAAKLNPFKS